VLLQERVPRGTARLPAPRDAGGGSCGGAGDARVGARVRSAAGHIASSFVHRIDHENAGPFLGGLAMYTLGINAVYHDPAACLVRDGHVIAAAEEERFTHVKHGKRPIPFSTYELPYHAIEYCLREAGIDLKEVDHIAYSYAPK